MLLEVAAIGLFVSAICLAEYMNWNPTGCLPICEHIDAGTIFSTIVVAMGVLGVALPEGILWNKKVARILFVISYYCFL